MIFNIYEVLLLLVLAGVLGIICGLFSYFLDYCFWPGSIFKGYLPWLAMRVLKRSKPTVYKNVLSVRAVGGSWQDMATSEATDLFYYKILGGCSVCFNIWLAMISFAVLCLLTFIPWWCCFPYILVSSIVIRKLVGATY